MKDFRFIRFSILGGVLLCGLWPTVVFCQDNPAANAPPGKLPVYLSEFSLLNASDKSDEDLGRFVNHLFAYRFSEINGIVLARGAGDLSCSPQGQQPNAVAQSAAPAQQARPGKTVFAVRGSLEFHSQTAQFGTPAQTQAESGGAVINYELWSSTDCTPKLLISRSEPLSRERMLESLTILADSLALRLSEEANKRTRIFVTEPVISGGGQEEFRKALMNALIDALAHTDDLQPFDVSKAKPDSPAELTLESTVRFQRSANPLRGFGATALVSLNLSVASLAGDPKTPANSTSYALTDPPLQGGTGPRSELFAQSGDAAVKGIHEFQQVRVAGLSQRLNKMQAATLVNRAKELLCEGMGADCTPRVPAALPLLLQAKQEAPDNEQVDEWLARAQYLVGRSLEAAIVYDGLLAKTARSAQDSIRLNVRAGEAWLQVQNFVKAAARYDRAAELLRQNHDLQSEGDLNITRSLSHRFKGDRVGGMHALLHAVGEPPEPDALKKELTHVVENMTPAEVPVAIKQLKASPDQASVRPALEKAHEKQAEELLGMARYPETIKELEEALTLADEKSAPNVKYLLARAEFAQAQGNQNTPEQKTAGFRQASQRLKEILKENPAAFSFDAFALQSAICSDYLGDKQCTKENLQLLEKLDESTIPVAIQFDLAELEVLDRNYEAASNRLNGPMNDKTKNLSLPLRTIGEFYRVWKSLAKSALGDPKKSFRNWQEALRKMRKAEAQVAWYFGGARRKLEETGQWLPERSKSKLLAMLDAMENDKLTIPSFD